MEMDSQRDNSDVPAAIETILPRHDLNLPRAETEPGQRSVASSLRMQYEAEVSLLIKKLGSLEDIRQTLGLSQRKMCQLLMVDPSAWSRWVKAGGRAPPHIYRALAWYLALANKYPALDVGFWLSAAPKNAMQNEIPSEIRRISHQLNHLESATAQTAEQNEASFRVKFQAAEHKLLRQLQLFIVPTLLSTLVTGCLIGFLLAMTLVSMFGLRLHF
jgi:transcriptional regulator with XRE-family HTH domain